MSVQSKHGLHGSMATFKPHTILSILLMGLAIQSTGAQAANRLSGASISVTICEFLAKPARFDKKKVRFRAKYGGTWEGMWLSDDACEGSGELILPGDSEIARIYGISTLAKQSEPLVQDAAWNQFESLRNNLDTGLEGVPLQGTEGQPKFSNLTAYFEGTIVIKRNYRFTNGFGNGWGHLGASRFLLILRSVSDVSAHSLDSATTH